MQVRLPRTEAERARRRKARRRGIRWALAMVAAAFAVVGLGVKVESSGGDWSGRGLTARWAAVGGTGRGPVVRWGGWGTGLEAVPEERLVVSPTIFALPTPVGFSKLLAAERPVSAEAVPAARAEGGAASKDGAGASEAAPLVRPHGLSLGDELFARRSAGAVAGRMPMGGGVFGKRAEAGAAGTPTEPRMSFGPGWEARMFSGLDAEYALWRADGGWSAEVCLEFDAAGVPVHMMLQERSGDVSIDKRLLYGIYGWRLRDAAAPRQGTVGWSVPAPSAPLAGGEGASRKGPQEGAPADG